MSTRDRLRKQAASQQVLRDRKKSERCPQTHAIDSALIEAISYAVDARRGEAASRYSVQVSLYEIDVIAIAILTAKGFDAERSSHGVYSRTKSRKSAHWTLEPPGQYAIPSKHSE